MFSKFMRGSPLLEGENTTPGQHLTKEEKEIFSKVLKACREYGLDFYPTIIQKVNYDEMSEVAAYGGFPKRYPHWKWGMEYEQLQRGYEYNQHRIFELVINSSPCVMYVLNSNTLTDNITVVAHATGHNDFFKNNVYFSQTDTNSVNNLANNGTRIKKYIDRWGYERVTEFIDHVHRIGTLIDPAKAWTQREIKDYKLIDKKEYETPRRIPVDPDREYMYPWLNTKELCDKENNRVENKEIINELEIYQDNNKDIFGFIKDNAPLKPWQQDILSMLYEEAMYFAPQRMTKTINEGHASFIDYVIMTRQGFVNLGKKNNESGIVEYSAHKAAVLGGKYSMNPYKLGFCLLLDIEDRWNKGKFGSEWENCKDAHKKENWNLNLGLGKEKELEVRKHYNDFTLINEFFTQEFCDEFEFFEWKKHPNGEYRIESRDAKIIKKKLIGRYLNGGLPDIRLTDPNHMNKGLLFLQHFWDGRILYDKYAREVMSSLYYFWGREIVLATRNKAGDEVVYICDGVNPDKNTILVDGEDYDRHL